MFLQKNLVFMHPERSARICKALAQKITAAVDAMGEEIDVVVSPAVGGIIPGYETARWLDVPSIYVEREGGEFRFRRGFHIEAGTRVAMVEDIVTTGLSSRECIAAIRKAGGQVLVAACVVDRSGGEADVSAPLVSLASLKVPAYPADQLPPELAAIPVEEPGSRRLKA
jgi:orotate phosphoribosyltransferase